MTRSWPSTGRCCAFAQHSAPAPLRWLAPLSASAGHADTGVHHRANTSPACWPTGQG